MRTQMVKFDSKILPMYFPMLMSRFQNMEAIDKYLEEGVPQVEAMCPDIGSTKWLFGTDELTQLDVHVGAMWDCIYASLKASAFADASARANLAERSPKWVAYIERLRAHPKIAPTCFNLEVADRHATRARGWKADEKCQLSLDVLKGAFPDLP